MCPHPVDAPDVLFSSILERLGAKTIAGSEFPD
jgi:hypothetical protein